MLLSVTLWLLLFFVSAAADHKPKRYIVNLDLPPSDRWTQVIRDHSDAIPTVAAISRLYIPEVLQPIIWWFASQLTFFFPTEYTEELKGIARESALPLGEVVGLNILYDITAFDRRHIVSLGCTSIVAEDGNGRIWHGRNLDYELNDFLKNITIIVDFKRNSKTIYSGITFALYAGLLTGQTPLYTISLNARYSGAYIYNILMELYTHFRRPVSFFIRSVLESGRSYNEALSLLSTTNLFSPSYIIIAGTKSGQGAVISRNRMRAADVITLNARLGRWFIVETNFDHWKKDDDKRRITATKILQLIGQYNINEQKMMNVLSTYPIRNNLTIFSSVMSAISPELIYSSTVIRD